MASNLNLVQYIAEQCAGAGEITVKKMFGDFDDKDYLSNLVRETCKALPDPKPKKKKGEKKLLILLVLLLLTPTLFAQKLGGGLLVGPAFSTMKISGMDSTTFRTDFTGGVRLALIPKRFILGGEIDVIYSRQGMRTSKGLDENGNPYRYLCKSHYINVPLLLNIYLRRWNEDDEDESKIPRLRIGPQIGFCVGGSDILDVQGKVKKKYITPWESNSFNRIDYGLTAAISYWFIEIRYTYGMGNVFKEGEKSTNHVISVTWSDIW